MISSDPWETLGVKSLRLGELVARRIDVAWDVFVAVDDRGGRHLIVPIPSADDGLIDIKSRGLQVSTRELIVDQHPSGWYIDLACAASSYWGIFDRIIDTVIEFLKQEHDPVTAVRRSIARWKEFWASDAQPALSDAEILGLFAELWFLDLWLLPYRSDAVRSWVGPDGSRYDFQWQNAAVEVKATASTRGHIHHVNGIEQLQSYEDSPLYIFSLRVRKEKTARNSLPSLITHVLGKLDDQPEDREYFSYMLSKTGYNLRTSSGVEDDHFRVMAQHLYIVADGFPRLIPESFKAGVPVGIEYIEYDINLEIASHLIVASTPEEGRRFLAEHD